MQLEETLLVVPDNLNGGRIQPRAPLWRWGAYTDVTAPVRVIHQDGSAYSLSGAVSALLAFYEKDTDDEPVLQLQWTIGEANAATFSIPRDVQTLYLPPRDQGYAVGVRFRDDDAGIEDVILLLGRVMIDGRVGDFNASVVVPSSQLPLAQGPNFGHSPTLSGFPAPALKAWLAWVADDTHVGYYSDGVTWHTLGGGPVLSSSVVSPPMPSTLAAATRTLYVRNSGSDVTGDGSLTNPFATPERARDQVRPWDLRARIDLTGYTWAPTTPFLLPPMAAPMLASKAFDVEGFGVYYYTNLEIYAQPTDVLTLAPGTFTAAPTIGPENHTVLTITTSPGWTADQWKRKLARLPGLGVATRVITNTANTITLAAEFFVGFDYTTVGFVISTPSCNVDSTGIAFNGQLFPAPITAGGGTDFNLNMNPPIGLTIAGLNFTNFAFNNVAVDAGMLTSELFVIGCDQFNMASHQGAGAVVMACLNSSTGTSGTGQGYSTLYGCPLTVANCFVENLSASADFGAEAGNFFITETYGENNGVSFNEGEYHGNNATANAPRFTCCQFVAWVNCSKGALRCVGPNQSAAVGNFRADSCAYGGIRMETGARCHVNGRLSGTGNGVGNGGCGIILLDGASMTIAGHGEAQEASVVLDPTNLTMTGPSGDILCGNVTSSWVDLYALGVVSDFASNTRIQATVAVPASLPTATASYRGQTRPVFGANGVADGLYAALKATDGSYSWKEMGTALIVTAKQTANYAAKDNDLVRCDPSAGGFLVTLPPAAAASKVVIKNQSLSTNPITLQPTGLITSSAARETLSMAYAGNSLSNFAATFAIPAYVVSDATSATVSLSNASAAYPASPHGDAITVDVAIYKGDGSGTGATTGSALFKWTGQVIPGAGGTWTSPNFNPSVARDAIGDLVIAYAFNGFTGDLLSAPDVQLGLYSFVTGSVDPLPGGMAPNPNVIMTARLNIASTSRQRVVVDGDSLSQAYDAGNSGLARAQSAYYSIGPTNDWAVDDCGVAGSTLAQWNDSSGRPLYRAGQILEGAVALTGLSINDLPNVNLAGFQAEVLAKVTAWNAAGVRGIVWVNLTPNAAYSAYDTLRQQINAWLATKPYGIKAVVDAASLLANPLNTAQLNSLYDIGDGTHWNAAGHALVSSAISAAVVFARNDTIDLAANFIMTSSLESVTLHSDGISDWMVV